MPRFEGARRYAVRPRRSPNGRPTKLPCGRGRRRRAEHKGRNRTSRTGEERAARHCTTGIKASAARHEGSLSVDTVCLSMVER
eukprot:CAMPEP_0176082562 /NCGR_PEP_ID=MMETSP0120_2-20121206/41301_1 /TAXON_ID=160619 /ORGANISM="Kryptoperidinium foliaceum, Strain CCMP 1326" /LENGTH=82 /DNA_ID=CAMNT_0017416335 /DNA_START=29 /DNA_END=273 /DNA_ORIENTATION=+